MLPLAAKHLLPGEGNNVELRPVEFLREGGGGGVAERQAFAVSGDPVRIRNADAGGRAVPGEDHVVLEIGLGKIGQRAVGRIVYAHVLELELLGDVGGPVLAEALPDQHVDAARAEHGPHGHLEGAGIGARDDADQVIGGYAQNLARLVDGEF